MIAVVSFHSDNYYHCLVTWNINYINLGSTGRQWLEPLLYTLLSITPEFYDSIQQYLAVVTFSSVEVCLVLQKLLNHAIHSFCYNLQLCTLDMVLLKFSL